MYYVYYDNGFYMNDFIGNSASLLTIHCVCVCVFACVFVVLCRSPLVEAAESSEPVPSPLSPLPQHDTAPAFPAHLLQDTVEFPTPPPTPPDRASPVPQTLPPAPALSGLPESPPAAPVPPQIQQLQHSEPSAR